VEARAELRTELRAELLRAELWTELRAELLQAELRTELQAELLRAELRTELWAELRTPARGADGATDAGEGDPEAGQRRLRERGREQRELEMCRAAATQATHSLLFFLP
jgi:hypothetical protein